MITSAQLSCCCWVRKTNLRATEQSESQINFTWVGGPSIISFANYSQRSASQMLQEKARATNDWSASMHTLFSVCSLKDDNVITSKPCKRTWKLKHANSILKPFEYFCQMSSKSIRTISSYTVSKLGRFILRHSVVVLVQSVLLCSLVRAQNKQFNTSYICTITFKKLCYKWLSEI